MKYIIPIFEFNYIGENTSSKDMWESDSKFHENLKEYLIDSEFNIILKKIENIIDWKSLNIDVLSQFDVDYLYNAHWIFEFNCDEEELDKYKLKINLLLLAFRISKQSDISIKYIVCKEVPHFSVKYSDDWTYAIAEKHSKRELAEINSLDLEEIIKMFNHLENFNIVSPRAAHAIDFLFRAYTSYYWKEAFLLLMTSLESLTSPEKIGEIVSEVTDRVVCLISNKNICSKTKFNKIYKLRSNIIHGKIMVDLNFVKELPRLQQLQLIVLEAFKAILNGNYEIWFKDEKSKENFFNKITMKTTKQLNILNN